ncbi:error-prone DNA polymerase [Aquabacter cavernae]|uniref:error-prone DNA polymerase n=1 Tax=Aquabacter cavernae TaxID=2496029 RepID=UPI000F8EC144|nr:error-prone DNA polymerase [Aquabacter cavernae]
MSGVFYAELAVTTNFSFLRGASSAGNLVAEALRLGHAGMGIADRNTVSGVVRAYAAVKEAEEAWRTQIGIPDATLPFHLAVGARLVFADGTPDVLAYAQSRAGWGRLCRLLTIGNMRAAKGACLLTLDDLLSDAGGLSLILMPPRPMEGLAPPLARLAEAAPGSLWLGADMPRRGDDHRRLAELKGLAAAAGVPLLAMNDVLYHHPAQRDLQDVLTCIREGTTIEAAGRRLEANAERHLKSPVEMARLFRDAPEAVAETGHFLARIDFSLGQLRYEYPEEPIPPGYTAEGWLEEMVWRRAAIRYPKGVPAKVECQLQDELALISELKYAPYFLTVHDLVGFAEKKGILCQGRGSAANSAVCYVLGITAVDPAESDLLFARFISRERREPPDIDVDFEHERREEVIQYIYERYGRARAGIAATVISYRPRSAIRDVGKALGLTEDVTARLSGMVWGSWGDMLEQGQIGQAGLDPSNPSIRRAVWFANRLIGFPRHLSQHVGGFVLTQGRLDEMVPIGNAAMEDRTFIEWNKDDIDTLALMKVDVLALGMLTCIRKAFDLIRTHEGVDYALADVPGEQSDVYDMLCRGDSIGVFQVESRAQINMLPRLKPRRLYDLVIQVAIVRPGPIQGNMVHPYLRRREGSEKVTYPSPKPPHDPNELIGVLERTKGVPLFQEQAMKLAMVAAEFTDVEANKLRRAMATFRNLGTIGRFQTLLIERMSARGYDPAFAARCFEQIKGFGEYGFPESHAASFAKLVYISAFIKCRHPAVFAAALLNAQPMGFYAPAQIVRDAREHGVEILPADINHSFHDNTLERRPDGALALRIGLRQIDGFGPAWAEKLTAARGAGYPDVEALSMRARLPVDALRRLADADAFGSLGLDRREAAWMVRRLPDDVPLPLFAAAQARELGAEPDAQLPLMPLPEQIAVDYQTTRLSLKGHPMGMLRDLFQGEGIASSAETAARRDGSFVRTAGIVLVRQRPGKGNAIFMTLEDETGIVNVVIWARLFERFRAQVMGARLVLVEGRVQRSKEGVIHLMAERLHDRSGELARLFDDPEHNTAAAIARPRVDPGIDERARAEPRQGHMLAGRRSGQGHPRQVRILPKSRDFH